MLTLQMFYVSPFLIRPGVSLIFSSQFVKNDTRELPGSIPCNACRPRRSEYTLFLFFFGYCLLKEHCTAITDNISHILRRKIFFLALPPF